MTTQPCTAAELIAPLDVERHNLRERINRRSKQNAGDNARIREIEQEMHRLQLKEIVGKPGGVKLAFAAYFRSSPVAHLVHARGTLLAVRRKWASVRWDNDEEWSHPLKNLSVAEVFVETTLATS